MADNAGSAVKVAGGSGKAKESLSQFVARVLDQLSLSAWLPAAALVLGLDFVFQLGAVLDPGASEPGSPAPPPPPTSVVGALSVATEKLAHTSLGGAVLLLVAIVVLTMVTQAFSFEAIRTLEGYWGTLTAVEWVAGLRRRHFARLRHKLDSKYELLTKKAWIDARETLEAMPDKRLTPNLIAAIGARALGGDRPAQLTDQEEQTLASIRWTNHAHPEPLRRRLNVDKKRRDYPASNRALPTRLGNILRAHEDQTGEENVETFVQRIFDSLPESLRIEHDARRSQLDLYCSMVFVLAFLASIASVRLSATGFGYVLASVAAGLAGMWLMYRAALASARAYGLLLVTIAGYRTENLSSASDPPST